VPLAGTDELRADLRRSRLLRLGLAAALVAALAGAFLAARGESATPTLVATGSDGVIVLDVSGSVGPREYRQLVRALDEAAESGRRYGLVAFSDVAYEVFPPGTDAAQVRALRRFFVPVRGRLRGGLGVLNTGGRTYRASVWTGALTGGTRISRGLALARTIIRRDRITNPSVVLISDLDFDQQDFTPLEVIIQTYARERLPIRVVALSPERRAGLLLDRFREVPSVAGAEVAYVGAAEASAEGGRPIALAVLGALLLLLLGANELACGRLTWLTAPRGEPA
jgi:Mg-chelatase subunit ChlD